MTSKLVEGLAEKMYKAERREGWRRRWGIAHESTRELFLDRAHTAIAHLKIPEDAEKVDVGEAVEKLRHGSCDRYASGKRVRQLRVFECATCEYGRLPPRESIEHGDPTCFVQDALRTLGAEVDTKD